LYILLRSTIVPYATFCLTGISGREGIMRSAFSFVVTGLAFGAASTSLWAGVTTPPSLTIQTEAVPIEILVGETRLINVQVGALEGRQLQSLGGTIQFDAGHLGTPSSGTAGAVVPDPADVTLTPAAGSIDAQFFAAAPAGNISSEGTFFSFEITGLAPGSGVIQFQPNSLFAEDQTGAGFFDLATNEVLYTVSIPEPATLALLTGFAVWSRRAR
jgi:hypothetical protein